MFDKQSYIFNLALKLEINPKGSKLHFDLSNKFSRNLYKICRYEVVTLLTNLKFALTDFQGFFQAIFHV